MQSGREVAVGLFQDPRRATDAVNALKNAGFSADDISLLVPADEESVDLSVQRHTEGGRRGTKAWWRGPSWVV
jgi:hypothetical protein